MKKPSYVPHLLVYTWASQFCYNRRVLDLGCGAGYGLRTVELFARECIGYDFRPIRQHHGGIFRIIDLDTQLIVDDFDVCLAFEILEHLQRPEWVCKQIADAGKTLIFSVPHDYPHALHTRVFVSEEEVAALVPQFSVEWHYLSGTTVSHEKPTKVDRYIGVATPA